MTRTTLHSLLFVALLGAVTAVAAQNYSEKEYQGIGQPTFNLNSVTLLSTNPGMTKVHSYVEVTHARLQFIKSTRGYEANYEVDLSVLAGRDDSAPRYLNRVWRATVLAEDFASTNSSREFHISDATFELPPGLYTFVAVLRDLETRRESRVTRSLRVPAYGLSSLELGDLILARSVELTGDRSSWRIVPNAERTVSSDGDPALLFFETYAPELDSLGLYVRLLSQSGAIVREVRKGIATQGEITRNYVELPLERLQVGRYVAEMEISGGQRTAIKGINFRIHLSGVPGTVSDLELAVRQLRYIAPSREVRHILEAEPDRREQLFLDYWESRDPTPETELNELMQEYYARVARANELFGGFRDGWETDRGEVFIRFGKPSEIERHPFEIDQKPYEVWYYYDIQRRFVFVDELGYGEYRLASNLWR